MAKYVKCPACGAILPISSEESINCSCGVKLRNPYYNGPIYNLQSSRLSSGQISAIMAKYSSALPSGDIPVIYEMLGRCHESKYSSFMDIKIKSPVAATIISIFFGGIGVDRFYVGDKKAGFGKLALWLITLILTICTIVKYMGFINSGVETNDLYALIGYYVGIAIVGFALSTWCFVDMFIIHSRAKKANAKRFYETIG